MHQFPLNILVDPSLMVQLSLLCIFSYFVVSAFFFGTPDGNWEDGLFKQDGIVDKVTSVIWSLWSVILLVSLIMLSSSDALTIKFLLIYYLLFIFFFAICYSLLEWHFNGHFEAKENNPWKLEFQFVILSVQTQTTLGYSRLRPCRLISELLTALQALIGLFFVVIFVSLAINRLGVS